METGTTDVNHLGRIVTWNGNNRTEAYEGVLPQKNFFIKIPQKNENKLSPIQVNVVRCEDQPTDFSRQAFPRPQTSLPSSPPICAGQKSRHFFAKYETWHKRVLLRRRFTKGPTCCRSLQFKKKEELDHLGIPAIKFQLEEDIFANGTVCPDNTCFGNNLRTGVQNVTQCKVKSPAFVSRPHFHLADPYYAEQFQYGVHPDPELHESSFWLEPQSSIPIKVEMRLQLNILLQSVPGMEYLFKDLQQVMFPVMWFDSVAAVPEEMAGSLRLLISLPVMFRVRLGTILPKSCLLLTGEWRPFSAGWHSAPASPCLAEVEGNKRRQKGQITCRHYAWLQGCPCRGGSEVVKHFRFILSRTGCDSENHLMTNT